MKCKDFFPRFWGCASPGIRVQTPSLSLVPPCGETGKKKLANREEKPRREMTIRFSLSSFVYLGQLVLGLASGLEAFSREPPCDSIGALAVRQTPETSGMAWEFLSYYPKLPSRCLRDPLSYLVRLFVCVQRNSSKNRPDLKTKSTSPEETQAQSPHYCFAQFIFSQFPAK